jgi:hypothetical protein
MLLLFMATVTYAQITPSDDAYVNSAAPTTNYGAATTLNLSSAADTGFIRFDLTPVPTGYTGSSVSKATLKLYVNSVTTAGAFNVDLVNGTWTEKTIKYSNGPALGSTIAASVPLTTASKGTYVEIDITSAMVEWLNGTQANDGIALVANSPLVATFDSKENTGASHAPEIDIVYAPMGGIQTVTASCTLTFNPPPNQGNQGCQVSCPKGTVLLSGGGLTVGGSTEVLINSTSPNNNGWWVQWYPAYALNGTVQQPVTVYAICAPSQ